MSHGAFDILGVHPFLATAFRGTESLLADELRELGAREVAEVPGGVRFEAPLLTAMRICMWSRIAMRVLLYLGRCEIRHERDIYSAVRDLPLTQIFDADRTISMHAHTRGTVVKNSNFASLLAKDAVCDAMRDKYGRRPSVDPQAPDISFAVHVIDSTARFYLEVQGEPLNQRGYRQREVIAPVKETIAAALLRFSWWNGKKPLHDPFCGSGTIAIEAAMIATDTAPGLRRERFGFERWPRFDEVREGWNSIRDEARQRAQKNLRGVIIGSDADRNAIAAARVNARNVGIEGIIFRQQDGRTVEPLIGGGTFVTNPPWGERLDPKEGSLEALYVRFGESLAACPGHSAAVFAPSSALKHIGLKPVASRRVFNGPIECRMSVFEIAGTPPGQFDAVVEDAPSERPSPRRARHDLD